MENLNDLLNECENLIRGGQVEVVRKRLANFQAVQVPRNLRLQFANLCRRVGLINLAFRLLGPIINNTKGKWGAEASQHELAEYAVLLYRRGSISEALFILGQINSSQVPESLLYHAFCNFAIWDYNEAEKSLVKYLTLERRAYQQLVGRVNLAACYVALEKLDEARGILDANIAQSTALNAHRLRANCLELRAQVHIQMEKFDLARKDLLSAADIDSQHQTSDLFFIKKWNAVIEGLETNDIKPIVEFREIAVAAKKWESIREADRFAIKIKFDQDRFNQLLFGTQHSSYRRALQKEMGRGPSIHSLLIGSNDGPVLDLKSGEVHNAGKIEPPQLKIHQVISALMRDFYLPFTVGALFSELCPSEHFDVFSSIHRVHTSIYRARQWLTENNVPAEIFEVDGRYSFKITGRFGILVPFERQAVQLDSIRISQLREKFYQTSFSSRDACQLLGISSTVFKGLIAEAVKDGLVLRKGLGRATHYEFQRLTAVLQKAA